MSWNTQHLRIASKLRPPREPARLLQPYQKFETRLHVQHINIFISHFKDETATPLHFRMPPSFLLFLLPLLPTASTQFIYPPNIPSDKTLSDYTSGNTSSLTNFVIHDGLWGSYTTPKPAFTITRCAQAGRTEPIYPSNSTFNSTVGQYASDGTWQWMDNYSNGNFPNVYSAGKNLWPILPIFEFAPYVGNETTGHVCWWELYSVREKQVDLGT